MTAEYLERLLRSIGVDDFNLTRKDSEYLTLDPAWVFGEFADFYPQWRTQQGLPAYREEDNDCDDFAFDAVYCIRRIHRVKGVLKGKALAFGTVDYDSSFGYHEINIFVGNGSNGDRQVYFFEPQRPKSVVTLTREELSKCVPTF